MTMPVSYDTSQLLKCTVSFTYSRYILSIDYAQFVNDPEEPTTPNGIPEAPFPPGFDPNTGRPDAPPAPTS
jgi:hypothetical protein